MNYTISSLSQLGLILKGFRKQKGMTQAELANQLNVTQQAVAKLEAAPEKASVEHLYRVLRLLDVNLVLADAVGASDIASKSVKQAVAKPAPRKSGAKVAGKFAPAQKPSARTKSAKRLDATDGLVKVGIQAPKPVIKKCEQW